jgi:hypothetical protein
LGDFVSFLIHRNAGDEQIQQVVRIVLFHSPTEQPQLNYCVLENTFPAPAVFQRYDTHRRFLLAGPHFLPSPQRKQGSRPNPAKKCRLPVASGPRKSLGPLPCLRCGLKTEWPRSWQ